ncbi:MAG TPA: 50S ribosomal protein L29 [Bryobacteraceae bacterium]|jgi:large subunit ribosomal protein L29|nr:50S ribosomal protein L29 [Bryobacteraceae bacterium]
MKENADKARGLDAAELAKQVKDTAEQMFRLRFQMSMGQMDGIKKLRSLRKERARMLTVLRERQDGAAPVAQRPARAKALPKPAAQTSPKAVAAVAKPKAAAVPKVRKEASQVKVKPTSAPKSAKISMPRKSGKG